MKARILLLVAGIASLTSCSSLYKTSQTPDDVYFSPARPAPAEEYVQNTGSNDGYQSYQQYQDAYRDDRFLRLSIGNPYYLSTFNDYDGFDWRYNAYTYYGNSPWSNYWAWNSYYNPYSYYCVVPAGGYGYSKLSFTSPVISKPVAFNRNSYGNSSTTRYVSNPNGSYYNNGNSQQRYNNSNSNGSYTPGNASNNSNNYHNNNTYTPTRSYSPSPSSSSSSGSSSGGGGGGGGVSRPTRN